MASDKQHDLVANLVRTRWVQLGAPDLDTALATVMPKAKLLDVRGASVLIDRLMQMKPDPDPTMPAVVMAAPKRGSNSSLGTCAGCGHPVPALTGWYYGDRGNWKIHHKTGECPTTPVVVVAPRITVDEGVYIVDDQLIRVYRTQNGYLAGQILSPEGRLVYTKGAQNLAATGRLATHEEVGAMGRKWGNCMCCGRPLSDDTNDRTSMSVGYGKRCAQKRGWPWG